MKKILTIVGTRPEAIKMAPVIIELKKNDGYFETIVCVTAQHRQMLDQVLGIFDITPQVDLNIMEQDQTLSQLTSRILVRVNHIIQEEKPDLVLVQGDTSTVMSASLASFYEKVPVGHLEAGLRTEDIYSPFPEEVNRRLTSVLATYHFAPTQRAKKTLLGEGVREDRIFVTGNTVIDALHLIMARSRPTKVENILRLAQIDTNGRKLILVTAHRRENFGKPFEEVCNGLKGLAERNKDISIVFPVHLNPNVREPVFRILGDVKGVHLVDPFEYDIMVHLMKESFFIITDSGGIQEEAPSLGKPVLVLRRKTERFEAIELGAAKIIGPSASDIIHAGEELLYDQEKYMKMAKITNPYGDGRAAERVVRVLIEDLA